MSRVWTRIGKADQNGKRQWVPFSGNDAVLTWLQQALLLQLGESPFWTDWGIPIIAALRGGQYPDLYIQKTKERFSPYFRSITIKRQIPDNPDDEINYIINAIPYGQVNSRPEYSQAPKGS